MELKLTDFIEKDTLQKMQDAFSGMTGMAALVTDENGNPVTEGSGFTRCCMEFVRKSPAGCERCRKCDRSGAELATEKGRATTYLCHAGLIDFAAPIMADGEVIGCFVGGQVLTQAPEKEKIRQVAQELGIAFEPYWEAVRQIQVVTPEKLNATADFLYVMAGIVSDIAYSRYEALQGRREVERASEMKSDFLASMSHEIRTPMNAVLGMAEMALREELPPAARNYIQQIKSSGKMLLNIINDILDFSKIESGKMDIVPVEYEMVELCDDVANIVETRLKDKRVELLLSVEPQIPCKLYGDNMRVRQILINLANNAAKFTNKGMIRITIDHEKLDADTVMLRMQVKDTGCGIRQEDLARIFDSFQQVDSKRNRGAEGTGLGLAICQKLLRVMGGTIEVQSEYEKGSTFTVRLPQKVVDWTPSVQIPDVGNMVAVAFFRNRYIARQFFENARRLKLFSIAMISPDRMEWGLQAYAKELQGKQVYLFTEEKDIEEEIRQIPQKYPDMKVVELVDFFSEKKTQSENWRILHKPLSEYNMARAVMGREMWRTREDPEDGAIDFIAPEAKVLIVDDNKINLTVTEGLLEPLRMKVYAITSGREALDLIAQHHFDLIFMDHMMPEMDGIETTHIIRQKFPQYRDTPILALTANAMQGMKELFLAEGMNDFVAKPIEVRTLMQKVKQWLPPERIIKYHTVVGAQDRKERMKHETELVIGDLDTDAARKLLGDDTLFWTVLKKYYKMIPAKAKLIGQLKQQGNLKDYTIEVHALKSTSRQIGAQKLAELAAELEKAGNEADWDTIRECTGELLEKYTSYIELLAPFCEEEQAEQPKRQVDREQLEKLFEDMQQAIEDLDMDCMESVVEQMRQYAFQGEEERLFAQLQEAVDCVDVETCGSILDTWRCIQ